MAGHLFIINGDLTKIRCDSILIPTDDRFSINRHWQSFLNERHSEELKQLQHDPSAGWGDSSIRKLAQIDSSPVVWLGNIGQTHNRSSYARFRPTVRQYIKEASEAAATSRVHAWPNVRLAVNLIGTDHGGASDRKGALVKNLVQGLLHIIDRSRRDVDIILVTFGNKPYAAAQWARRQLIGVDDTIVRSHWNFVDPPHDIDLVCEAHALASHAHANRLVLFAGAGVSAGAGLHNWKELLQRSAMKAGLADDTIEQLSRKDARDQATILDRCLKKQKMQFKQIVAELLTTRCYSLTHGLLSSLPSSEAVTTNFDTLFEEALRTAGRPLAILPNKAADADGRWLLKLHGSIDDSEAMILTRFDYLEMPRRFGALLGLLQGLLMMRHMLFVGYSLIDEDFHEVVHEIRQARGHDSTAKVRGTVLTLRQNELDQDLWFGDLRIVPMTQSRSAVHHEVAARQLEIFLDLVGYLSTTTASFFLDKTYNELSSENDLRRTLTRLFDSVKHADDDKIAHKVADFLRKELGAS